MWHKCTCVLKLSDCDLLDDRSKWSIISKNAYFLRQYKLTTIQWLTVNTLPLRGFSQIDLHLWYLHIIGSTTLTWVIYMCSTLITKAINGTHYKESNQAGICQICHNLSPPSIHALHYLVVFFNIIWRFGRLFSYCKHVFFPYCIQIININTTTLLGNSKIQNTEQQVK